MVVGSGIEASGTAAPEEARYTPLREPKNAVLEVEHYVAGITSIVWCAGYHAGYRWIELPSFDGRGYPGHERGVIPHAAGRLFPGPAHLGFGTLLRARDAEHLASAIEAGPVATKATNEWMC
jgi:putative flavoprotein involved in K+ transport